MAVSLVSMFNQCGVQCGFSMQNYRANDNTFNIFLIHTSKTLVITGFLKGVFCKRTIHVKLKIGYRKHSDCKSTLATHTQNNILLGGYLLTRLFYY